MQNLNLKKISIEGALPAHSLSNDQLLKNIKELVGRERELLLVILQHLREVEDRQLFCILGFGSLFDYAVSELRYSEAAAGKRVSAMRLLKEFPSLETSIQTGELTLSNIATVQSFLREEKKRAKTYTLLEKQKLFENSKNLSQRECQRQLATLSPQSVKNKERISFINSSQVEIQLTISKTLLAEIEELKNLISHELVSGDLAEVIEISIRKNLKEIKKRKQGVGLREKVTPTQKSDAVKAVNPTSIQATPTCGAQIAQKSYVSPQKPYNTTQLNSATTVHKPEKNRHIPIGTQRAVRERAGQCCEFVDSRTGRRCTSQWKLEIDHQMPFSFGGKHTDDNLRLLCRNHHSFYTVEVFGERRKSA